MYTLKVTDKEINKVLDKCFDAEENGSVYPGMTYEQGVDAAIRWMIGEEDIPPLED